ncbi:MAG: oligosaccharide flippase family protein, partial [Anaerolineae bacterium]|nr:oligosaccharide flippase family protein [Anaerolineae bacterium]
DAYLVAYSIPFSAYIVLREVVKPAFLPTFLQSRREAEGRDWRLFGVAGTLLVLLLGVLTAAGLLLAQPLTALAAPGFAGQQRDLAASLLRLVMPALLLLGASSLTTAALHANKRFALPAIGEASFRALPILFLLATGGVVGTALGVMIGALSKVGVEAWGLRRHLAHLRPSLDLAFEPVRTVGRLAAPLLGALFLSLFVGPLVENAFASKVGVGGVAALAYSRKIVETLTTILPYTLGLVLLPFSAEMAARHDSEGLARMLGGAVRSLVLLFLPVTVGLMALREPFVRLLLERGAFTAASTELTAGPLFYYALALVPFSLEVIVIQFFFARQDTLTPVLADVASFALNVALIPLLLPTVGLGGIALAAALAKAVKVLALLILFSRRVPAFRLVDLAPFSGKMLLAALATAAILGLWILMAESALSGGGIIALAAYLSVGGLLGGGTFFLTAHLLRVQEPAIAWQRTWAWTITKKRRSKGEQT